MNIHYSDTLGESCQNLSEKILFASQRAIDSRGRFCLVLSGGSTPVALYSLLTSPPFLIELDWPRTFVFFGDERMVPPEEEESNYHMAYNALLKNLPIPCEHIFRIWGEADQIQEAQRYEEEIIKFFETEKEVGPLFDLILLGLGSDGHTASLFSGTQGAGGGSLAVPVPAPQHVTPKVERVSLTFDAINRAREVCFLVSGCEKREIVRRILQDRGGFYPAARVKASSCHWFLSEMGAFNHLMA